MDIPNPFRIAPHAYTQLIPRAHRIHEVECEFPDMHLLTIICNFAGPAASVRSSREKIYSTTKFRDVRNWKSSNRNTTPCIANLQLTLCTRRQYHLESKPADPPDHGSPILVCRRRNRPDERDKKSFLLLSWKVWFSFCSRICTC